MGRGEWAAMAVVMASIGLGAHAHAGIENAGTTAANFLALGTGARTLAMAGASLGLGEDAGGAAWNPAALGWVNRTEAALSHAGLPDRSLQEWGAVGGPIGGSRNRWALAGLYQGDGRFEGTDASGAATEGFSVASVALGATLARRLGDHGTFGVAVKVVREEIASASGSGITFDTGVMMRAGWFGLGIAAQNLGGQMSFGTASYPFPTSYGIGVGFSHPTAGLLLALDANLPNAYHADLRAGAEWLYRDALALRAGYRHELGSEADPLTGPTFGVGVGRRGMWLDYGYLLPGDGIAQHRMGIRFGLGGAAAGAGSMGAAAKPGDFDWARDGSRPGPSPPQKR